jgi:hypothetical protein
MFIATTPVILSAGQVIKTLRRDRLTGPPADRASDESSLDIISSLPYNWQGTCGLRVNRRRR